MTWGVFWDLAVTRCSFEVRVAEHEQPAEKSAECRQEKESIDVKYDRYLLYKDLLHRCVRIKLKFNLILHSNCMSVKLYESLEECFK